MPFPSPRPDLYPAASTTRLCAFLGRTTPAWLLPAACKCIQLCLLQRHHPPPPPPPPAYRQLQLRLQQHRQSAAAVKAAQGAGAGSWTLIAQAERKICTAIYIMRILFFLWPQLYRHQPPFESPRAIFLLLPSLCNKVSTFLLYGCGFASTANWTRRRPQLMLMLRLNLMRSVVKLLKATHTYTHHVNTHINMHTSISVAPAGTSCGSIKTVAVLQSPGRN